MIRQYDRIRESMQTAQLDNGLRICYIPKTDFSKTFAMLATDFGSVDASFTLDGIRYDTPAGVAHFLEHKMFEDEDGNALQKFGVTGASPNAFTSRVAPRKGIVGRGHDPADRVGQLPCSGCSPM